MEKRQQSSAAALMAEYENQLPHPTLRLDYPETFSQRLPDCPYLCDDGLLWKPVERERVVDMTEMPPDDGNDRWLQQEIFVVADGCYYCN